MRKQLNPTPNSQRFLHLKTWQYLHGAAPKMLVTVNHECTQIHDHPTHPMRTSAKTQPMMGMFFQSEASLDEKFTVVFCSEASRLMLMVFWLLWVIFPKANPAQPQAESAPFMKRLYNPLRLMWSSLAYASSILG